MDVSIIYINYNSNELLLNSIESVLRETKYIDFEIIIVDNASTMSTDSIKQICNDKIHLIYASKNLGFGKANNLGMEAATGRNILFLNPDTILCNNAIKILSDTLDNNLQMGACGGNLYSKELEPTHSFSRLFPSILKEADSSLFNVYTRIRYGKNAEFNHTEKDINVAYVCGADLMVRKNVIDKVGTFDPDFFLYYEETELEYRIQKEGYKICSIPHAKIIHLEGGCFNLDEERERHIFHGRDIFFSKTYSTRYRKFADRINLTFLHIAIIIFQLLGKEEMTKRYEFRKNLYNNKE
ncbi:MAG: glycosyltransferase family 2 protein [Paludibacteraceae bacterium]